MTKSNSLKRTQPKNLRETIYEMIGKIKPVDEFLYANNVTWRMRKTTVTVDYSKTDYALTKAIFYASERQRPDGSNVGGNFLFGAAFGKPIVNASAAFAFAKQPEVKLSKKSRTDATGSQMISKDLEATQMFIDDWKSKFYADIWKTMRNSLRDGDYYVRINRADRSLQLLSPDRVTIVDNELTGDIIGYDVEMIVEENTDNDKKKFKYVTEYRKISPYVVRIKYDETGKELERTVLEENAPTEQADGQDTTEQPERVLPIVPFQNEREGDERYGNSEYQNCFYLMANYHEVLKSGIENGLYNNSSVAVISGVDNPRQWKEVNGTKNPDTGEFEVRLTPESVLIGGDGFDAKFLESAKTAEETTTLLKILFYLICQTSETPEFVFGTAVQSSKASVSEQMPIAIMKAQRKQTEYKPFLEELFKVVIQIEAEMNPGSSIDTDVEVSIKYPPILDEDRKLNVEVLKALREEGLLSDKTAMLLAGMQFYVEDIDSELADAKKETDERAKKAQEQFIQNSKQATQNISTELDSNATA